MAPHQDHDYFSGPEFDDRVEASLQAWITANDTHNDNRMSAAHPPPDFSNQNVAPFGMYGGPALASNAGTHVMYDNFAPAESIGLGPSQSRYTRGVTNGLIEAKSLGNGGLYQSIGIGDRYNFEGLSNSMFDGSDLVTDSADWNTAHANSNNTSTDAFIDIDFGVTPSPGPITPNNTAGLVGVTSIPDLPEPVVGTASSEHAANIVPPEPTVRTTPSNPAANTGLRNVSGTPEQLPLEFANNNASSEFLNTANAPVRFSNTSPASPDSQGWEFVNSTSSDFDDGASVYSINSQSADDNNVHTPDASDASGEDLVDDDGGHDNTVGLDNSNQNAISTNCHVAEPIKDQRAESRPQWAYAADPPNAYAAEIIEEQRMKMASSPSYAIHIPDDDEKNYEVVKANTQGSQSSRYGATANAHVSPYANASDFNNRAPGNNSRQFNGFVQHQSNYVGGQEGNNMPGTYAHEQDPFFPQHSSPMRPTQNRQSAKSRRERRSSSPLPYVPTPRSPPRPVKPRSAKAGLQAGPSQAGPSRAGLSRAYAAQFQSAQGHPSQFQPAQGHPSQAGLSRAGPPHVGLSQAGASQARSFQAGPSQAGPSRARPSQAGSSQVGPSRARPSQAGGSQAGPSPAHQSFAPTQPTLYAPASSSVDAPARHVQSKPSAQVNRKRKSIDEAKFDTLDVQQAYGNGVPAMLGDAAHSTSAYPTLSDLHQMQLNYKPVHDFTDKPKPLNGPAPIYAPYAGHFATSAEAKQHRKRIRHTPQQKNIEDTEDLDRVKRIGRPFWVRRLYNAMIDVSCIADSESSIHRNRFVVAKAFDEKDIEAAAHKIFDEALAVHERGWNKPIVYYKKVHRGKLQDHCLDSVEKRLALICKCLFESKAAVDDALRGGITLALLCDNPIARGGTKQSNNAGNARRGERLKMVRDATVASGSGSGSGSGSAATPASTPAQTTASAFSSTSAPGPSMGKGKGRAVETQEEELEGQFSDQLEDDDGEWQHARDGGELYGNEMYGMEQYGWGDFE
jgi:hypothetical protein